MEFGNHHTTSLVSVFDVWATYDRSWGKPHYPSYEVVSWKVGTAFSLDVAERIVRETVRIENDPAGEPRLHSLRIVQIPVGRHAPEWAPLSEYLYDRDGVLLDRRTVSWEAGDVFPGRTAEEIRFGRGDLVEVLGSDSISLGIVAELPPSVERASRANTGGSFHLGAGDDTYVVLTGPRFCDQNHVDSLRIFKPLHRITPGTQRRLRKTYNDYRTFPMRMMIADTAAAAQLQGTAESLGWRTLVATPLYEDGSFSLSLEGVPGFPDGVEIRIPQRVAWRRMDRVIATLKRLAGKPAEGRGYRLKGPGQDGAYQL